MVWLTSLLSTPGAALAMWLIWRLSRGGTGTRLRPGIYLAWCLILVPPFIFMQGNATVSSAGVVIALLGIFGLLICSIVPVFWVAYLIDRYERKTKWHFSEPLRIWLGETILDLLPMFSVFFLIAAAGPLLGSWAASVHYIAFGTYAVCVTLIFFSLYPYLMKWVWRGLPAPADDSLRRQVLALVGRSGLTIRGVIILPGARGRVANAMISGILPRHRMIFLTDHLIERLTTQELLCIVGHELGHVRHAHLVLYCLFALLNMAVFVATMSLLSVLFPQSLLVVMLEGILLGTVSAVLFGAVSRRCERQADAFSVKLTGDPAALKSALSKLDTPLKSTISPTSALLRLLRTHPDLDQRWEYIDSLSRPT